MTNKFTRFLISILIVLFFLQTAPGLIKNIQEEYINVLEPKTKVATMGITNEIMDIKQYVKNIRSFFMDKEVKAILLRIDSPGGSAGPSQALFEEIRSLKTEYVKPVVVLSTNICASGAYYIACSADYIIASPSALIGSIGSYINFFKINDFMNQCNIQYVVHESGAYKTAGNPFTKSDEKHAELLQGLSDDIYNQFKEDVAKCRKIPLNEATIWANGKIFTGKQALTLGLIDETGSEYNAIKKIKELALIENDIEWVKPPKTNAFSCFLKDWDACQFFSRIIHTAFEHSKQTLSIHQVPTAHI